jgi:hypothetical protein
MTKPIIMTAGGLVYAAAAASIVFALGDSHRRALRDRRSLVAASVEPKAEPKTSPIRVEPGPAQSVPSVATSAQPDRIASPEPASGTAAKKDLGPVAKGNRPPLKSSAAVASGPSKLPPFVMRDLAKLPTDEEAKLGAILHDVIVAYHGEDANSSFPPLVMDAITPLLDMRERKDVEIRITVLDSNELFAFSHLGGYIYMSRGLFTLAATPEEYRFVAGRELAHIDLRHGQAEVDAAMKLSTVAGVGTLQYLYHQVAKGYSPDKEFAADEWIVERMTKLENTKKECLAFLRKFVNYSKENGFQNGIERPLTGLNDSKQDIEHAYLGRPPAYERLKRLTERLKGV